MAVPSIFSQSLQGRYSLNARTLNLQERAAPPNPPAGSLELYADSNGEFRFINSAGVDEAIGGTSFDDSTFSIYDDGDDSKVVNFQVSNLTTSTTRTITVPDNPMRLPAAYNASSIGLGDLAYTGSGVQCSLLGVAAGEALTTGAGCTFLGSGAGASNLIADSNTAVGSDALALCTAQNNTAVGRDALVILVGGQNNCALGATAGDAVTSGSSNVLLGNASDVTTGTFSSCIVIGDSISASATQQTRIGTNLTATCFVRGIDGVTTGGAAGAVLVDASGQLGTISSSARFKGGIADMEGAEKLFDLRPVNFHYLSDEDHKLQYGLIAEEVNEIIPEIVIRDVDGQCETVQYYKLSSMLLKCVQLLDDRLKALEQ